MANIVNTADLHRIVLTVIIHEDRKYLITKRPPTQKAYPNMWTVPGGGLERGDYIDTPKTTETAWYRVLDKVIRREIKEEVALEIGTAEYLMDLVFIRPDDVAVIVLSFFAPYVSGEVVLEEEAATEYAWVTVEEAKNYELIPGILEEIKEVDDILSKRN
jgi:8-oxo-dGTP pyrophosphatase MutT (NUDIX family)